MVKRLKALPAAMAIVPSIAAEVPPLPAEKHNDPAFWTEQARMAKLDGRVTLANEAELAAKRAERRTGKAPVVEEVNPIDANAERQIVQAAAEREARKPVEAPFVETVIPDQDPGPVMASSSIQDGQDESPDDRKESVETPIAAEVHVEAPPMSISSTSDEAGKMDTPDPAPFPAIEGAVQRPKRVSARAKAKALDAENAEPTPIAVLGETDSLRAQLEAEKVAREEAAGPLSSTFTGGERVLTLTDPERAAIVNGLMFTTANLTEAVVVSVLEKMRLAMPAAEAVKAPERGPDDGLSPEEEAAYQALAARRKPDPKVPSAKDAALIELLTRTQGANRKEMLAAMNAKAGASPSTCERLAKLYGYRFEYISATETAPVSYRLHPL